MRRPRARTALAVAAGLVLAGSVAFAAIPAPDGVIHGCYNTTTGILRAVETDAQCRSNEKPLSWNQTGPQGLQGPAGPAGESTEIWYESRPDDVLIPGSPPGPVTWQLISDLEVPAGTYLVSGATTIDFGGTNLPRTEGRCELLAGGNLVEPITKFVVAGGMTYPMSLTGVVTASEPTSVEMRCFSFDAIAVANTTLTAVQVAATHS